MLPAVDRGAEANFVRRVIMQNKSEVAERLFMDGFSCAQSVLAPFCEEYELDTETALRMAAPLGGGCGIAEVCGAVSGGVLVVGLKHGNCIATDTGTNMNCRAKRAQFIDEFKKLHDTVTCRGLLGFDLTTEDGHEKYLAMTRDRAASKGAGFVKNAARILEEQGY